MARIGVLAVQGDFSAHIRVLSELGHEAVEVRQPKMLSTLDGLILPGGESSAQLHAIVRDNFTPSLHRFFESRKPILATCAGAILVAKHVKNPNQNSLGWIDITVSRNAWGSQVHSFEAHADNSQMPLVFIRAPRIIESSPTVTVLVRFQNEPVMVQQNNVVAATFHPELTSDRRIYQTLFSQSTHAKS